MDNYNDVMDKALELSETCLDALEHIKLLLNEGYFQETIGLMDDLVHGFYQIEKALQDYRSKLADHQLESVIGPLRTAIAHAVTAYEHREWGKVLETIQFSMMPRFKFLKAELAALQLLR